MKKIIVANWKCNPTTEEEAKNIFEGTKNSVTEATSEVVVCPPFVFLPILKGLVLGAQNCFYEEKGAFTGEVSGKMLKDLGVEYVIVGHSERRKYFGETDEIINQKIKKALESGLKVIFCVGETAEERGLNRKKEVLEAQIRQGTIGISAQGGPAFGWENIIIAYEPVWAIGTGDNCSIEETRDSIDFIKLFVPTGTRIIYGGSVTSENSGAYIKEAGADGLLVGGASLNAEEFVKIVLSAE